LGHTVFGLTGFLFLFHPTFQISESGLLFWVTVSVFQATVA